MRSFEVLICVYLKCRSLSRDTLITDLEMRLFKVLIFSERYNNYKSNTCLFEVLKCVYLKCYFSARDTLITRLAIYSFKVLIFRKEYVDYRSKNKFI